MPSSHVWSSILYFVRKARRLNVSPASRDELDLRAVSTHFEDDRRENLVPAEQKPAIQKAKLESKHIQLEHG